MIVNVIDSCGDSDCNGCCTQNQGDADSPIEWADLGERIPAVCD